MSIVHSENGDHSNSGIIINRIIQIYRRLPVNSKKQLMVEILAIISVTLSTLST